MRTFIEYTNEKFDNTFLSGPALFFFLIFTFFSENLLNQEFRSKSKKMVHITDSLLPPEGHMNARIIRGKMSMVANGEHLPLATIIESGINNGVMSSMDGSLDIKVNVTRPCKLIIIVHT
ncbi:MAG: hypothetical protein Q8M15_12230 [Bacteroidota bacterium]|nr:hypothetical protein [Bacteroidota bacterium]